MSEAQRQARAKISGRLIRKTRRPGKPIDDMQTREAVCLEHGVQTAVYLPNSERWGLVCCGKELRNVGMD